MPVATYRRLDRQTRFSSLVSLEVWVVEAGEPALDGQDPVAVLERAERRRQLDIALESLPSRQAYVLRRILADSTLAEIAGELGVNESRVSQIKSAAVAKLRVLFRPTSAATAQSLP
jgi:RNA polymerase sigma factor (sigma-70 family)